MFEPCCVITTEYFGEEPEFRGYISATLHEPLSRSPHLTHIDLEIEMVDGTKVLLKRVDADKIAYLAHACQRAAGRPVTG